MLQITLEIIVENEKLLNLSTFSFFYNDFYYSN